MDELDNGSADAGAGGEAVTTIDDTMSAVFDKMERDNGAGRDDTGRFASDKQTPGAEQGDGENQDSPEQTGDKGAATPTQAPQGWTDEEKAEFAKLSPEVQKAILRRESDRDSGFTKKSEEIATERKRYEGFNQLLAPIEAEARKFNMPATTAIQQMFQRHMDLQTRGVEALKDIAKLYGIPFDGTQSGGADTGYVDPEIATLKSEISTLKRELGTYRNSQTEQHRNAIEREMDSVRDEKDKDGKPLRPHFEALYDDMTPIVTHLRTKNPTWTLTQLMTEAYDRAANANPDIRAKLAAEKEAKDKAEQERKAKEEAKQARKARDNNTRTYGTHQATGSTKGKSMDDTMSRVFDELNAA